MNNFEGTPLSQVVEYCDIETWAYNQVCLKAIQEGKRTIQYEKHWKLPPGFNMHSFMEERFTRYHAMQASKYVCFTEWGLVIFHHDNRNINVWIYGYPKEARKCLEEYSTYFRTEEFVTQINWVYSQDGRTSSVSLPMERKNIIKSAYPFINAPVHEYMKSYDEAESCILILSGPPGTGKTSFIRELLHSTESNAFLSYDNRVLEDDAFFAQFIKGDEKYLILEDSDNFIGSRKEGNNLMHRFLNLSDGLVSTKTKKIIFTTNLPNITDIDKALLRPGRCFDVIEFRDLTYKEAVEVGKETGKEVPDVEHISLADIFNKHPTGTFTKRRVGF